LKSRLPSASANRRNPELIPAALAIVLVLAAVGQLVLPSGAALPTVARTAPQAAPLATAPVRPTLYGAIMAHPIFAPDRAPPPAEAEDTGNLNGVTVLGTAIAGKNTAAALVRDSEGEITRVKVGEEVEGWKLVAINKAQLTFDRNGEQRTLAVDISKPVVRRPGAPGMPGTPAGTTMNGAATTATDTTSDDDSDDDDSDQ
jgi:hypothetical protein